MLSAFLARADHQQMLWLVFGLAWGTAHLPIHRHGRSPGQSDWGFGQWLPLLLLALPIFTISQQWYGKSTVLISFVEGHPIPPIQDKHTLRLICNRKER